MNSALTGKFQAYAISDELVNEHASIRSLEKLGKKFITLLLNDTLLEEQELRLGNVYKLRVFQDRQIRSGNVNDTYNVEQGHLIFRFDPHIRRHAAYIWDDDMPGEFSKVGYNRDFLASHHDHRQWEIEDDNIRRDIARRLTVLKANLKDKEENPVADESLSQEDMENISLEGLEAQIEALTKAKEKIILGKDVQPEKKETIPEKENVEPKKTIPEKTKKSNKQTRKPVSNIADIQ